MQTPSSLAASATPTATSSATSSTPSPITLSPTPLHERQFGTRDHAALWFSLGVGLLVMQVGSYLMPALSTQEALLTIVLGSMLGAGLLAWMAKIACDTGLSSAALMTHVLGRQFAKLPITLNLVQLVGWGTFELVVMRDATVAIAQQTTGASAASAWWPYAAIALWGGLIALLICGSMVQLVRRVMARIALPLVVASLLWLSWHFVGEAMARGWHTIWHRAGEGGMGWLPAMDLVIAMPISWLPLVADYARHGRSGQGALRGTWLGFALANIWCYGLGVLVTLLHPGTNMIAALLLAQGGLIALSLILLDEMDNAYGDTYSGAMAAHSLQPRWSLRAWGLALIALSCVLAMVLPMHSIEPFLLMLSSVFVPLCGVIVGRLAFASATQRSSQAAQWMQHTTAVRAVPVALWLGGIVFFHSLPHWLPGWGAALPTLALTWSLAFATRHIGQPACSAA